MIEFPGSLRVHKYHAMHLEALEMYVFYIMEHIKTFDPILYAYYFYINILRYDEAIEVLDSIIKKDETNAAPRKRRVALLKAKGKISEAIKELTEYLKK